MRRNYHILGKDHNEELSEYLSRDGQLLLALVQLLETSEIAVDELIDIAGRSTIETVLKILAQGVAGAKHQGKRRGKVGWHRSQTGVVSLLDYKLMVKRPRIRRKGRSSINQVFGDRHPVCNVAVTVRSRT